MMTQLYMRSATDQPHVQSFTMPSMTACGLPLLGSREVSALQVLVYLEGKICRTCQTGERTS